MGKLIVGGVRWLSLYALVLVLPAIAASQPLTYFDDFSSYTPGQPPPGYLLRGASGAAPTVQEVGGTGPAYRRLSFPYVSGQSWDSWALKDGLTLQAPYVVSVKMNFQTSGDRGGLTIAWDDTNWNRIDIQPNIFWQDIEFRISYTGPIASSPVVTGPGITPGGIPMQVGTDYWLQVAATSNGPGQGQVIVSWSTDGTNFTPVVTARGLADVTGLAGMGTAGPNLPNVYFDDFSVSEDTTAIMQVPTSGYIGFLFHQRLDSPNDCLDVNNARRSHQGIDIWTNQEGKGTTPPSPKGHEVWAIYGGTLLAILDADNRPAVDTDGAPTSKASILIIDHGLIDGQHIYTLYAHMANADGSETFVDSDLRNGQSIVEGALLGHQGNAFGRASPNSQQDGVYITHLHFEVKTSSRAGQQVDPSPYM